MPDTTQVPNTAQHSSVGTTAQWIKQLKWPRPHVGPRLRRVLVGALGYFRTLLEALASRSGLALALRARKVNEVDRARRLHLALGTEGCLPHEKTANDYLATSLHKLLH